MGETSRSYTSPSTGSDYGSSPIKTDGSQQIIYMPNIAVALKAEISRIAKKELKGEIAALKKTASAHRSEIAGLKRQLVDQAKVLRTLQKSTSKPSPAEEQYGSDAKKRRFSAKRLTAQRQRMGLSAREFGQLIGASAQSVYNWEAGNGRPSPAFMEAIAQLRSAGKRAVRERLGEA
jgi:DNA-binding transcriptional regulator YiaG